MLISDVQLKDRKDICCLSNVYTRIIMAASLAVYMAVFFFILWMSHNPENSARAWQIDIAGHVNDVALVKVKDCADVKQCAGENVTSQTYCCKKNICCTKRENELHGSNCNETSLCPERLQCMVQDGEVWTCDFEIHRMETSEDPGSRWIIVLVCVLVALFIAIGIGVGIVLCCCMRCGPCKKERGGLCNEGRPHKRTSKSHNASATPKHNKKKDNPRTRNRTEEADYSYMEPHRRPEDRSTRVPTGYGRLSGHEYPGNTTLSPMPASYRGRSSRLSTGNDATEVSGDRSTYMTHDTF